MSSLSRRFHTVDGALRKLLQERCWQQRLQLRIIRAMVAVCAAGADLVAVSALLAPAPTYLDSASKFTPYFVYEVTNPSFTGSDFFLRA